MSTTPFTEPKKARRKVTTDLGRQLLQKERQRLTREQAALGEQLAEEAKRRVANQKTLVRSIKPAQIAVSKGIITRIAGVLASEGLNVRITAKPQDEMRAWTDFDQIYIGYRMHDDVRLLAATMRGLAYHEGGHCRFTVPFLQLVEMVGADEYEARKYHKAWNCLEDQRMETAVTSDSPRKAAYITTTVMTELTDTADAAASNYPLLIWRKYLPRKIRKGARRLFVFKQNAMGQDGEALARRWEQCVTSYVLGDTADDLWAAVIEAHELLQITTPVVGLAKDNHTKQQHSPRNRDDLDGALVIPVAPSMLQEAEDDLMDYDDTEAELDLTDPEIAEHLSEVLVALWNSPEELITVVYGMMGGADETPQEGEPTPQGESQGEYEDASDEASDAEEDEQGDSEHSEPAEHDGDDDDQGEEEGEQQPQPVVDPEANDLDGDDHGDSKDDMGGDDTSDGAGDEDPNWNATADEDDDEDLTDEDLDEALQDAEDERDSDPTLDGDVRSFNDALDNRVSDLDPLDTQVSADVLAAAAAQNLATELEESFYASTMDKAPAWVEQQKRGVLNVMRYKTRQPGDTEFFRQWTEDDQPGFNISVSVLLDNSVSMGSFTEELAQAGYATKLACEKLGIPCTVVLWNTSAAVLWDANEKAEYLPVVVSTGGTNPIMALADLHNQRYEKMQHLVLIMTDGQWQGDCAAPGTLAAYGEDGRVIIGIGFNPDLKVADSYAENMHRYGSDESYGVTDLMQIPRLLEQALVAHSH
jgi:hypothetical protein